MFWFFWGFKLLKLEYENKLLFFPSFFCFVVLLLLSTIMLSETPTDPYIVCAISNLIKDLLFDFPTVPLYKKKHLKRTYREST